MADAFNNQDQSVHWTAKLPLLVIGIVLALAGVVQLCWTKSKVAAAIGLILIVMGASFIGYSMTIKNWCVPGAGSAFSSGFGQSFAACARMKGWIEF